jgi:hypothetical protein
MTETIFTMQEENPCRKLTLHKPESTRRVGRPAATYLESVAKDFNKRSVRNCRRKSQDRDQWRVIVEEVQVHHGLQRPQSLSFATAAIKTFEETNPFFLYLSRRI